MGAKKAAKRRPAAVAEVAAAAAAAAQRRPPRPPRQNDSEEEVEEQDQEEQEEFEELEEEESEKKQRKASFIPVNSCTHLTKGINVEVVQENIERMLKSCWDCNKKQQGKRSGSTAAGRKKKLLKQGLAGRTVWICLACAHVGCEMDFGEQPFGSGHAEEHSRRLRHPLVHAFGVEPSIWCFLCKAFITRPEDGFGTALKFALLQQAVELVHKGVSRAQLPPPPQRQHEEDDFGKKLGEAVLDGKNGYVKGLMNLGNTCFFNSVMQNLLAVTRLQKYFLAESSCGREGPLTSALRKFFQEINSGPVEQDSNMPKGGKRLREQAASCVNPKGLFGAICAKSSRFKGFQQQDSHELLRCLLDGLQLEEEAARRDNGEQTLVERLFGGTFASTVKCCECGHSSTVLEPFLDLSLPIPTSHGGKKTTAFSSSSSSNKDVSKRQMKARKAMERRKPPALKRTVAQKFNEDCQITKELDQESKDSNNNNYNVPDDFGWLDFVAESDEPEKLGANQSDCVSSISSDLNIEPTKSSASSSGTKEPNPPSSNDATLPANNSSSSGTNESNPPSSNDAALPADNSSSSGTKEPNPNDAALPADNTSSSSTKEPNPPSSNDAALPADNSSSSGTKEPNPPSSNDATLPADNNSSDTVAASSSGNSSRITEVVSPDDSSKQPATCESPTSSSSAQIVEDEAPMVASGTVILLPPPPPVEQEWEIVTAADGEDGALGMGILFGDEEEEEVSSCTAVQGCAEGPSNSEDATEEVMEPIIEESFDSMTLQGCLSAFTKLEILSGENAWACERCSGKPHHHQQQRRLVKREATKSLVIQKSPPVLTVHLKRFAQDMRGRLNKLTGHVAFEEVLNLNQFQEREDRHYRLVGVVEHSGTMRGGHYVAFVRGKSCWYYISDSSVRTCTIDQVLRSEAYLLFYERLET